MYQSQKKRRTHPRSDYDGRQPNGNTSPSISSTHCCSSLPASVLSLVSITLTLAQHPSFLVYTFLSSGSCPPPLPQVETSEPRGFQKIRVRTNVTDEGSVQAGAEVIEGKLMLRIVFAGRRDRAGRRGARGSWLDPAFLGIERASNTKKASRTRLTRAA